MNLFYIVYFITFLNINLSFALSRTQLSSKWTGFKGVHQKKYSNRLEEALRFQIFKTNAEFIEEHNAKANAGQRTFTLKMNQFGDLTPREFSRLVNGFDEDLTFFRKRKLEVFQANKSVKAPPKIDWTNLVTPVKDQGSCGSCWAFSATGAIEAQHSKKTGKKVSLSEQHLMDCSVAYAHVNAKGNNACQGGYMNNAFRYLVRNKAINSARVYPYEGKLGQCRYKRDDKDKVLIKGFTRIPSGSEKALENAVATVGPVAIAIDAGRKTFQFYNSGVYFDPECQSSFNGLNHAVLAVGYGKEGNSDYWLVKNSWGTTWEIKVTLKWPNLEQIIAVLQPKLPFLDFKYYSRSVLLELCVYHDKSFIDNLKFI